MKYQSELIKEMIDSRGHEKSSIHYQSECIETWIEEAKGAYPKLCDYESEWLNYIVQNPIGEFPYETVSTNRTATVNNVVPYAYKSAILKGNTLVNISSLNGEITIAPGSAQYVVSPFIKRNTTFTISFNCLSVPTTGFIELRQVLDNTQITSENINVVQGYNRFKVTTVNKELNSFRLKNDSTSETDFVFNNLMIIEGDYTNKDIPYFEGMKSVQMPVLKTTGKNLFDINSMSNINNWDTVVSSEIPYCSYKINLKPNTTYTFSQKEFVNTENVYASFGLEKGGFEYLLAITHPTAQYPTTFTITTDDRGLIYLKLFNANTTLETFISELSNNQLQLEEGIQATSYEPHKSNILTTSEDVTLRGIGDVQDTLNCLTGEIIESIGESVLNGSEEWIFNEPKEQPNRWCFHNNQKLADEKLLISDRLPQSDIDGDRESIRGGGDFIFVYISKEKVDGNVNSFKQWLSQNPIKYQYRKSEKSIKTVDLSVNDQNGNTLSKIKPIEGTMHIIPTGEPIAPTAVLEVPVEAVTQNLASFIEEE